jgi:hypothetical protein
MQHEVNYVRVRDISRVEGNGEEVTRLDSEAGSSFEAA